MLYRATHFFDNPCCLCAVPGSQEVVEAAVYIASEGELCNFWVAGCAREACGYLGKLRAIGFSRGNQTRLTQD